MKGWGKRVSVDNSSVCDFEKSIVVNAVYCWQKRYFKEHFLVNTFKPLSMLPIGMQDPAEVWEQVGQSDNSWQDKFLPSEVVKKENLSHFIV